MLTDNDFLGSFETLTLPPGDFDHRGHLRLAWLYLGRLPPAQAMRKITEGIPAYASSLGADDKYHHTLTVAIVRVIAQRMANSPPGDFDAFLQANRDLMDDMAGVLLGYYSEARLFSAAARQGWILPDRKALPEVDEALCRVD